LRIEKKLWKWNNIDVLNIWFNQIKEKKHILLFGGDEKGIQKFDKKAKTLVTVSTDKLIKEKDISIQLVPIGKDNFEHFWSGVESLFISQAQRRTRIDNEGSILRKEIQKLLSFKNESTTWAVLSTGPSVVMVNGINTVKVLDEFSEWKGKALKMTFKEYLEKKVPQLGLHKVKTATTWKYHSPLG
jgi:hypothetical protein